jgi:hypothetical protein
VGITSAEIAITMNMKTNPRKQQSIDMSWRINARATPRRPQITTDRASTMSVTVNDMTIYLRKCGKAAEDIFCNAAQYLCASNVTRTKGQDATIFVFVQKINRFDRG